MSDSSSFDTRKCAASSLPHDIALAQIRHDYDQVGNLVGNCALPWARRVVQDLQSQEADYDSKHQPTTRREWYEHLDRERFRTPENAEEKAHLFEATARQEIIELANKQIHDIIKSRELAK